MNMLFARSGTRKFSNISTTSVWVYDLKVNESLLGIIIFNSKF
jgi:hypothetical protein